MTRIVSATLVLLVLATQLATAGSASAAERPSYPMPSKIDQAAKYLIYFHNYYVEANGTEGDTKHYDILKAFADRGLTVISEVRPKDASVVEYGKKGAADVRTLLNAEVPPENVTIAGHSKGGVIALQVASFVGRQDISYVILAGCGIKGLEKGYPDFKTLKGNFLSIYATSDTVAGSCRPYISRSTEPGYRREIALDNPAGHQVFFSPTDEWVDPVADWAKKKVKNEE